MSFSRLGLSAIVCTLIVVIPAIYYIKQDFEYKNTILREKENEKKLNQESYDKCFRIAEYEHQRTNRDMCWVYNHDATECDLTYFETYSIGETPITKYKKDLIACDNKYPAIERLYSQTSPDYESLLTKPLGNLTEREAVRKILGLQEFKDFENTPDGTLRYNVEAPSIDKQHWKIHIYADDEAGNEITLNYYKVNAFNGEISRSKIKD